MKRAFFKRMLILMALISLGALSGSLTQAGAPASTPQAFYGIQMRDNLAEQVTLPLAQAAGIQWIRLNLRWAEVEEDNTDPPTYNWSKYDTLIGNATAAGFSLIITVRDNPSWAATTACGPINKVPTSRFIAFLTALVTRYSQPPYNVKMWELYNEPDNNREDMPQQGGCWGRHPDLYAALLGQVYPAIKAADPQSSLVLGGLAHDLFEGFDDGGIFNPNFLPNMLDSPGGRSFDIMNFHYYRAFDWRWNPFGRDVIGKATYIRGVLSQRGLNKPVIVTEIGDPSEGPASDQQDYSDARSSRYVVQAHVRGMAAGLHSMIWFEMADGPSDPRKYGLLRSDYTPKPAYQAYKVLTSELGGASYLRQASTSGLETYVFNAGGREKFVSWSTDSLTRTLSVTGTTVWVVEKLGERTLVGDGSPADRDGRRNGAVAVDIGIEPRYVYPLLPRDLSYRAYMPALRRGRP